MRITIHSIMYFTRLEEFESLFFFHFRILSGFVGILAASAARRIFFVAEIGGKRGEFGGKLAEDGGDSREIYFFDWRGSI